MFDFVRDIGKSQAEKDREMLSAYVDGQLNAADARRMEEKIQSDPVLQAEANQLVLLKQQLRAMPHRRIPRSFVLDPTLYGAPERRPLSNAYPVLRTATALTALLFVFLLGLSLVQGSLGGGQAPAAPVALFEAADEAASEVAEAPLAAEAPPAEDLSAATAATVVEEESLESAAAETLLVQPEAEAELALPADALDLNSTVTEDAAMNGADEEAAKDLVPSEAEAAQAEAAAAVEPRVETERTVSDEAAATATGAAGWLPWVLLVLGVALVALLLMTVFASRQSRV